VQATIVGEGDERGWRMSLAILGVIVAEGEDLPGIISHRISRDKLILVSIASDTL